MNAQLLTEDGFNRLAKALMLKHSVDYGGALRMLGELHLHVICDVSIRESCSSQAALLTAVNCGKRAFHGGVSVSMPESVGRLLPWPGHKTLNQIICELGATLVPTRPENAEILLIGPDVSPAAPGELRVLSTGWRGGVVPADEMVSPPVGPDFASGGILAGALGVAKAFFRASGISVRAAHFASGGSLWNPSAEWLQADGDGPELEYLPKQVWFLGLGHLGQAAIWNFGLLPFADPAQVIVQLQDFDRAVAANLSAGLLCEPRVVRRLKTRIASEWLEERDFSTRICERAFDELTLRQNDEPRIALCGFDSAEARLHLANAGFDLVVECGVGGSLQDFDSIMLHTFPDAPRTPQQLWGSFSRSEFKGVEPRLVEGLHQQGDCGILGETLARKAISTAFVGAFAGACVIGELLRGLHSGPRIGLLSAQLRSDDCMAGTFLTERYLARFAKNGFVRAQKSILTSTQVQCVE